MAATDSPLTTPPVAFEVGLFRRMLLIRRFEERVLELRMRGMVEGVVHPCIGQEAVAVGACAALEPADAITSTHRGHGHCIAKGAAVDRMMAELFGKRDGYCRGKGGSMHIADFSIGMVGANGIVAAGLPIAAGAGLARMLQGDESIALCFFSEGAAGAGPLHEVLNIAALWQLPVVFLCENNGWAAENPTAVNLSTTGAAAFAAPHGIPAEMVDGNDVLAVYRAATAAAERARAGGGPSFVEAETFRLSGHAFRGPRPEERDPKLVARWAQRDPVAVFRARLLSSGQLDEAAADAIERVVEKELDDAVRFAEQSPFPDPAEALDGLFAG